MANNWTKMDKNGRKNKKIKNNCSIDLQKLKSVVI